MADALRAWDWSATPLGGMEGWSPELLAQVNSILACPTPMMLFWGPELTLIYNDGAVPVATRNASETLGQSARDVWKEAWPIVGDQVERALAEGVGTWNERVLVPLLRKGVMEDVWFDYSYSAVFDRNGIAGVLVIPLDVTASVLAERALQSTGAELKRVLDVTTDGILSVDRNWRITYGNAPALDIISPIQNIVGRDFWEVFPAARYEESPYVEHYTRAMEEGVAGEFEAFYPEPVNIWVHVHVRPSEEGIVLFFRDSTRDVAAREALQRQSEQAEYQRAQIESLYRSAPIGLALFDVEDFRYLKLNNRQAEFFGLEPEQIVGRTLTEMAPIEGLRELFTQVREGNAIVNYPLEGELITRPGEHRYWTVSYFPVVGEDGQVQAITAASLEITQQRKAELALIQSEKLAVVGRLASSIAHEINNPLESVTNLLYLAGMSDDVAQLREYIEAAQIELRRASAITNHTLRFHRQSTSPLEVTCEELIQSVLVLHESRLVNSHVQVEKRKRVRRPIRCFEGEIRQVLSNLVVNAIDAMRAQGGGRLLIRSREGTQWKTGQKGLVLTVADTGTGMSEAVLKRIFEPFYTTKGVSGTGLGLWVSSEIIARHHGSLRARSSQAKGRSGTIFTMFLPFVAVTR